MSLANMPKIIHFNLPGTLQTQMIDISEFNAIYIDISDDEEEHPEIRVTKYGNNCSVKHPDTSVLVFEWGKYTPLDQSKIRMDIYTDEQIGDIEELCAEMMLNDLIEFITSGRTRKVYEMSDIDNYIYIATCKLAQ